MASQGCERCWERRRERCVVERERIGEINMIIRCWKAAAEKGRERREEKESKR
jgi:hypothetical protein